MIGIKHAHYKLSFGVLSSPSAFYPGQGFGRSGAYHNAWETQWTSQEYTLEG